MAKQNNLWAKIRDSTMIIFVLSTTFFAGGVYFETKEKNAQFAIMNCNFDRLITRLKIKGIIEENFCKIEKSKIIYEMTDSRIPKNKRRTQRIAIDETAINSKEDLESIITE